MKKLNVIALLTFLATASIQPANAGLVIGALSGNAGSGAKLGFFIGAGTGALVGVGVAQMGAEWGGGNINLGDGVLYGSIGGVIGGAIGAILDVDASISSETLGQAFKAQYPFINNAEALNALASTVKSKLVDQPATSSYYVSLTSTEVLAALSGAQITAEQFAQIANDLK